MGLLKHHLMLFATPKDAQLFHLAPAVPDDQEVDEVKDIRDKAMALESYARQAKNFDAEARACEIRLRAERKAGQLSAQIEHGTGNQYSKQGALSHGSTKQKVLEDAGISRDQASKWERLADVPDDVFEASLKNGKPSTNGNIASAKPAQKPMDDRAARCPLEGPRMPPG